VSPSNAAWMTRSCTASARLKAHQVLAALRERMRGVGLGLHPDKDQAVNGSPASTRRSAARVRGWMQYYGSLDQSRHHEAPVLRPLGLGKYRPRSLVTRATGAV
jgi:hypothetical protein